MRTGDPGTAGTTDIQEANASVVRLSSAQVLALFGTSAKESALAWFTFLVSRAKQAAAQIGLIARANNEKAEVQICIARARDAEAMLAEERRKNEILLQQMTSLERELARDREATRTHAEPRNLTRGALCQAKKGLSTPDGLQTLSSL